MNNNIEKIAKLILEGNVACLTGAGISTAAGIPDFRGVNGLYTTRQYDPDTVFDINYFAHNPKPFFDFSRDLLNIVTKLKPTFTHYFLAELEKQNLLTAIITQNIDPLHQLAGSEKIICLHGNYASATCRKCGCKYSFDDTVAQILNEDIPHCRQCGGVIKPDIVFFGENVYGMSEAIDIVTQADTLLVLGSSLAVYPAASLPEYAKRVIVINKGRVRQLHAPEEYYINNDLDIIFHEIANMMNLEL